MGMIALAGSNSTPDICTVFSTPKDEMPLARLRTFADANIESHFGVRAAKKPNLAKPQPLSFEEFEKGAASVSASKCLYPKNTDPDYATMFIDSGAFSVWSGTCDISIDDLAGFVSSVRDKISYVFNLDVLPGAPGRPASRGEGEASCEASLRNWYALKERGHETINTYHEGEPIAQLLKLRDLALKEMKDPFIALSDLTVKSGIRRAAWFAELWKYLVDKDGKPLLKVHGLGVLDIECLSRFPWFSVDGTSWQTGPQYGVVMVWMEGGPKMLPVFATTGKPQNFTSAEHDEITRIFGCSIRDIKDLPKKEQRSMALKHNLKIYKRLEGLIPDRMDMAASNRGIFRG